MITIEQAERAEKIKCVFVFNLLDIAVIYAAMDSSLEDLDPADEFAEDGRALMYKAMKRVRKICEDFKATCIEQAKEQA